MIAFFLFRNTSKEGTSQKFFTSLEPWRRISQDFIWLNWSLQLKPCTGRLSYTVTSSQIISWLIVTAISSLLTSDCISFFYFTSLDQSLAYRERSTRTPGRTVSSGRQITLPRKCYWENQSQTQPLIGGHSECWCTNSLSVCHHLMIKLPRKYLRTSSAAASCTQRLVTAKTWWARKLMIWFKNY